MPLCYFEIKLLLHLMSTWPKTGMTPGPGDLHARLQPRLALLFLPLSMTNLQCLQWRSECASQEF